MGAYSSRRGSVINYPETHPGITPGPLDRIHGSLVVRPPSIPRGPRPMAYLHLVKSIKACTGSTARLIIGIS